MFAFPAYAQTAGASGGVGAVISAIMPFLLIIPIFYFLLIRPQKQRMKAHQSMVAGVARGDTVVTAGGLIGKVKKVTDLEVEVEIAANTVVKVVKGTLTDVRGKDAARPAND